MINFIKDAISLLDSKIKNIIDSLKHSFHIIVSIILSEMSRHQKIPGKSVIFTRYAFQKTLRSQTLFCGCSSYS